MKQFSIEVKDRVGELARVTEALAERAINIVAIASEVSRQKPRIHIVTEDQDSARKALEKSGREFREQEILVVKMLDRPGELAKVARKLARSGVNVESIYLFGKNRGYTEFALAVDELDKAKKILDIRD